MECFFCKKNEEEINNIFKPIIEKLEHEISIYEKKLKEIANIISKENKKKIETINKKYLTLTFNEFIKSFETFFLGEDHNFQILKDYYDKYNPPINKNMLIKDFYDMYINESDEDREAQAIRQDLVELDKLKKRLTKINLLKKMEKINEKIFFPLLVFDLEDDIKNSIITSNKNNFLLQNVGMDNCEIYLCPNCLDLYKKAKSEYERIKNKYEQKNLKQNNEFREPNPLESKELKHKFV